jgi:PPOX class probable FMN-dependent enzyme
MDSRFSEALTTEAQIMELLGQPSPHVLRKVTRALDGLCRDFIARSPYLLIASGDADGNMDVSPKGDPAGFVRVLDDCTLAIPDRPGNRRADTFRNVMQRPQVALLFLVPGRGETLRLNGSAMVVRDQWLREQMAIGGNVPALALVVKVGEVFFHCPKCALRSNLWDPAQWPDLDGLASFARTRVQRCGLEEPI